MDYVSKIIRTRRSSLCIEIAQNAEVIIRVPFFVNNKQIQDFINEKAHWIQNKVNESKRQHKMSQKNYVEGETFYYLGYSYPLKIQKQRESLKLDSQFFLSEKALKNNPRNAFINWYRSEAKVIFEDRVGSFSSQMGLVYNELRLSGAKTRWGCCTSDNNLRLSWRLVMAPMEVVDYVIIHELSHLKEHNHSNRFWQLVGKYSPHYKEHRKWLRENRGILEI